MMSQRRPAYAQELQAVRLAGRHPWGIQIVVGGDWRPSPRVDWPRLALKPEDWRPHGIDWRVCAGVPVMLLDRITLEASGAWSAWLIYAIAGELADVAADVSIVAADVPRPEWIHDTAFACRLQTGCWPGWWSDAREARARANRAHWHAGVVRWMDDSRRTGT